METAFKICGRCKRAKSYSSFYKSSRTKDGRQNRCKVCVSKCNKIYSETETFKKSVKRYHKKDSGVEARRKADKKYKEKMKRITEAEKAKNNVNPHVKRIRMKDLQVIKEVERVDRMLGNAPTKRVVNKKDNSDLLKLC